MTEEGFVAQASSLWGLVGAGSISAQQNPTGQKPAPLDASSRPRSISRILAKARGYCRSLEVALRISIQYTTKLAANPTNHA